MWLSPDSFLMAYWSPRCDSAWFFTCGKAWMEGMTPYVDFADSKGPLLWLIYGIGYLLSPTSYVGVFWLSVVAYTFTFEILWRTARLFVGRREAVAILAVMSALLFLRHFHDEVRAEDFCMPWICAGLYCTTLVLLRPSADRLRRRAFWLGVSMAWCLLIKWNLFVMMGGMAVAVAVVAVQRRCVSAVACGLAGIVLPLLPFVAYLSAKGCFHDMVNEYFVNTFLITDNGSGLAMWKSFVVTNATHLRTTLKTIGQCSILAGIALFCVRRRFSWWLLFAFFPFFFFIEFKSPWCYYAATTIPFFVYPFCELASMLSVGLRRMPRWLYCALVSTVCLVGIAYNVYAERLAFVAGDPPAAFAATERILVRHPFCKIMFGGHENGWGLRARALPACKYWALQNGASDGMKRNRAKAIAERRPDYVVGMPEDVRTRRLLVSCGYRQCSDLGTQNGRAVRMALPLYERP